MLALPDGYTVGPSNRQAKMAHHQMLGDEWTVIIYYQGYAVFQIAKQFAIHYQSPKYFARMGAGCPWQQFKSVPEMIRVMTTKHRLGVKQ
jgi:hypothetical protein